MSPTMKFRAKQTSFFLMSFLFLHVAADLHVHTKLGSLRGTHVSVKGKEAGVHAFLGIPFAKPPVGPALRLAAPQPVEGWKGVRDATQQPLMCVQNVQQVHDLLEQIGVLEAEIPEISEDCLYLNIYTPANRAPNAKLPVMVWIHGGGFGMGSASMYDGSAMAAYQDMVVVLIQYRLGLLGFLSTGDEHMSGNFGLLDQVQALRWVQEHIHNFGGNPDLVTIFGESAGGVSVSLLLLSPLSDGLFHRAIAESGTAAIDILTTNDPLSITQMAADVSGCSSESTEKLADCMKNLDFETFVTVGKNEQIRYAINVDGHFLTKPVDELFQKHELLTVPFMTGVNDDEGGWLLPGFFAPPNWTEGMDREYVQNGISFFSPDPIISGLIVEEYIGNGEDRVKNRDGFTEMLGDLIFTITAIKAANAHRDAGAPVYLYEYQYSPKLLQKRRPSFVGSDHGDEIFLVLGFCFTTSHVKLSDECSEEEMQLSRIMMSYWANFARTGSPNGDGLAHWPKYGAEEHYLQIRLKEQVTGQSLKKDRFVFLTQTLPEKIQQHKSPEVHTKLGSLRGMFVSVKGKLTGVHAFLGIPFAKPPVGPALRLAAPQPVEGWKGVRDATQQPLVCVQHMKFTYDLLESLGATLPEIPDISEDCLYLNIYTPANRAPNTKLPVMVWIHGGGFGMGSASMYDGSAMAAYQDVVVVLIQYRLGALGFLSTGDEHMSGNFGLLDQVQALRWVQEHIHNFGGNPDLVTIFGESAGGVSVSLLLLSPLSDGLFHHAIAESGTAAMDVLLTNDPLPTTQVVANITGCSFESTEKLADCMKNLDFDTFVNITSNAHLRYPINVDGHFLTKPVEELFQKHELLTVPFMTGVNDDEGGWLLTGFFGPPNWTEGMDREQVQNVISFFNPDPIISGLIVEEYIGNGEDRVKNRYGFTEMLGDLIFNIPAIKAANAHRDAGAPVYLYEYQHPPKLLQKRRPSFVGTDHGDELMTVLGFCFTTSHIKFSDECCEEEMQLSRTMMSYWANFARTGSPNGDGLAHWPKYGAEEHYLQIRLKEQVTGQSLKKDRFVFLTQTLPEKIQQHKSPEVHTKLGSLRGMFVSVKGKLTGVHAFLGIPFAKPPVGPALRLAAPQPVEGWKGVRDATQQPLVCVQHMKFTYDLLESLGATLPEIPDISEDCLYLNIYTPANRAPNTKLPVMVWIHGGGFGMGSASMYDGSAMAAYQDVVVVLIQYRLGALGFLSTGDEHMSGNFGLLDQVQALRWVQEHIHNFGGNPDLVTIFGESAGGVSVSLLLLSPLSDGLFHHAIAESGTAAMDVLLTNDPLPTTQVVANITGCSFESTEKLADCMKNLDFDTFVNITSNAHLRYPINVDGHFLTKPVEELFQKHELLTVPFMTGVNDDEGGWLLPGLFGPPNWTEGMDREYVQNVISFFNPDPIISGLIVEEYIGNGEDRVKNRDGFTEMLGDVIFNIPAIKAANAHRDAGAPVYLYEYQHPPKLLQKRRPSFVGTDHADELMTVLGFCFTTSHVKLSDECSEEEMQLSRTMMSYWANFARTGSPNGDGLAHWPKYGAEEHYLEIRLKEQVTGQSLKKDRFVFLTQTLPEKIQQHKSPEVHTKLGSLRGMFVSVKGKLTGVHAFLGIPFAKPPVGPALRLAAPQPVEGWKGVRDATQQPSMCVQHMKFTYDLLESLGATLPEIADISEDCLYLNIYTPANRDPNTKLPVMVWIHGGGFAMGSASMYDGSAMAAYQDVVVVLIQYRLGALGFLSTGDEHMSGNFGLLDQVQALRWVQEHIHNFGGNPDLVTIFGESAGGISVSLLLLSPLSDGLFHHAIAESGTAAMDVLVANDPLPTTQVVANVTGCSFESTEKLADCMKNVDFDTFVDITSNEQLRYAINVDGHFLTKPVDELFQKHELLIVPFMTGFNDDEGGWLLSGFFAPPNWAEGMDREQVHNVISIFSPDPIISGLIVEEYIGNGEDRVKNRDGFTEMLGDLMFNIPAIKAANAHRDAGAPVYLYEYQHPPKLLQKRRPSFVGTDHADEILTVLGFCFTTSHVKLSDECSEEEMQLSRTMMSYWANFARTGSPNGDGLAHWPKYGAEEHYLEIRLKEQVTGQSLKKDRFVFLTQTLPEKIQQHKSPEVHTKLGSLRGMFVSVKGKLTGVHAFLGIPFAKPPVGPALRLAAPQPVEGWKGVRDATQQPSMCVQNMKFTYDLFESLGATLPEIPDISEDCLYLNIYTPANRDPNTKLPVMVWIHGGGFAIGSASMYDGSAMAAYQDVVVVLIQYRLGALGFLSTGDEHMSGNFGLLDQVQALRWIQEHIHNFGGNPDLVTIFGESAGGVSVSLMLLSPLSNGLFHRAIAESGTATMDLLIANDPLTMTQVVANITGCSFESTEKLADCMKNLDFDTFVNITSNAQLRYPINVDGHFLTKPVEELFQKHELLTVPFMTGVNDDEGGWLLPGFFCPPNWTEGMDREHVQNVISFFNPDPIISGLIVEEYIGNGEDRVKNRDGFTEMLGDVIFNIPAIKAANAHRDAGAPVYLYEYQHPPKLLQKRRPSFVGTDHADELMTVLGFCFTTSHDKLSDECTEEEMQLSRTMMSYWANFARTGSPNGDGLAHWPKYGAEEHYLEIRLKEQVTGQSLKKDRFVFLTQTLPEKIQQHKSPEVHTKLGSLRGMFVSVKGKLTGVHAFLGIPFAKPPVGPALRLAAPQPVEGWKGVRDATQQPSMCVLNMKLTYDLLEKLGVTLPEIPDISEDCLYLNIYTPANRAPNTKLPVMVWIHGGGFTMGSASMYDGSAMAAYQDVVVVLIQYRLGALGFLSTGDEHMSGNFGMLDQVQALRWVQEHIHNFGGNPDLVTIFGGSAGGVSVSLMLLSPLSDGLFHHAIAESGTAAMDLLVANDPLPTTQVVANITGCSFESTEKLADCMKNVDFDTFVDITSNEQLRYPINVDGHFLTKPVDELFQKHELLIVPFMTGVNDDEGGWLLPAYFAPPNWTEGMDREHVQNVISIFNPDPIISGLITEKYIGNGEDRVKNRDGFTEMLGDLMFTIPAIKAANAHRDAGAPVYLYEYQCPPKLLQKRRLSFVGTDHGDELMTVLGFCFTTSHVKLSDECSEEEMQLSRTMMSYWANFARTGSPNGDGLAHWPKYGAEEHYLEIRLKEQVTGQSLKKDRFVFLTQTLPEQIRQHQAKKHSEL